MALKKASNTAEVATAVRALGTVSHKSHMIEDHESVLLRTFMWKIIGLNRFTRWLLAEVFYNKLVPGGIGIVLFRTRYTEELVRDKVKQRVSQYLILGAGLDTFALRHKHLAKKLQVIEIDHPLTQEAKQERYQSVGLQVPLNNHMIPVDFEKDNVIDGLERSPYVKNKPAIISWLGVTFYLTPADSLKTLKHLAEYCAPGTELVFDYLDIGVMKDEPPFKSAARMKRFVARRGEPFQGSFDPKKLEAQMKSVGLDLIANYTGRDQLWMYPPIDAGPFGPCEYIHIAHVRVPPKRKRR